MRTDVPTPTAQGRWISPTKINEATPHAATQWTIAATNPSSVGRWFPNTTERFDLDSARETEALAGRRIVCLQDEVVDLIKV